jgi:UDPglucose 6-dehydrogenase
LLKERGSGFIIDRILIGGDTTEEGQKAIQALDVYTNWVSEKIKILTTNVFI